MLAPIVLISACGLLCLVFYNRLAVIVSRIRTFNKDLAYIENTKQEDMIKKQIDLILTRAFLIKGTLLSLIITILMMLLTSVFFGSASFLKLNIMVIFGFVFFYLGVLSMMIAMIFAIAELFKALLPVRFEYLDIKSIRDLK